LRWLIISTLVAGALLGKGYWNATRDPVIRTASLSVEGWPKGAPPLVVLLISDIHVAGPDMPPERLRRIVGQFNALKPDLVLIAGDLIREKRVATHIYRAEEVVAPLGDLKAPLGIIATLGNHDHWFDAQAIEAELTKRKIVVLKNSAIRRGPLVIGGVDDDFSGHDNLAATYAAMHGFPTLPKILLTHSPDIVPKLPSPVAAVFSGHTHCGQIVLPLYGAISYFSRYGSRFACGLINDDGQAVVVGAGLGASILPLRYGVPPDAWLVTLGPANGRGAAAGSGGLIRVSSHSR
jgi:uncharacterized protein